MKWLTDVKAGAFAAVSTVGTWIGTLIDLIPENIGKLAALAGLILTCTMIYCHLTKRRQESERHIKEMTLLEFKLAEANRLYEKGIKPIISGEN